MIEYFSGRLTQKQFPLLPDAGVTGCELEMLMTVFLHDGKSKKKPDQKIPKQKNMTTTNTK